MTSLLNSINNLPTLLSEYEEYDFDPDEDFFKIPVLISSTTANYTNEEEQLQIDDTIAAMGMSSGPSKNTLTMFNSITEENDSKKLARMTLANFVELFRGMISGYDNTQKFLVKILSNYKTVVQMTERKTLKLTTAQLVDLLKSILTDILAIINVSTRSAILINFIIKDSNNANSFAFAQEKIDKMKGKDTYMSTIVTKISTEFRDQVQEDLVNYPLEDKVVAKLTEVFSTLKWKEQSTTIQVDFVNWLINIFIGLKLAITTQSYTKLVSNATRDQYQKEAVVVKQSKKGKKEHEDDFADSYDYQTYEASSMKR